jgi:DNA-directed RNA polymerase specialized sigma24 family protein
MPSEDFLDRALDVFKPHGLTFIAWLVRPGISPAGAIQRMWLEIHDHPNEQAVRNLARYCWGVARSIAEREARDAGEETDALRKVVGDSTVLGQERSRANAALEQATEKLRLRRLAETSIDELDPVLKEVYFCIECEELSYEETADRCDLSFCQVERYIAQARRQVRATLRALLEKELQ